MSPARRPPSRSARPRLERLEDRTLLSAGDLDPGFGAGGKVLTGFQGSYDESPLALARQSDGKLVVAGTSIAGSAHRLALARYNADGSLDATFGSGGLVATPVDSGTLFTVAAVAEEPDGKLAVVGTRTDLTGTAPLDGNFLLARYTAAGALDTTFGGTGIVTTDFGGSNDQAAALLMQPDGKLVAVGTAQLGSTSDVALARYNADGSLDQTFGSGGLVAPHGPTGPAFAAVLQADGRIVVAGSTPEGTPNASPSDFALRRFNPDGTLDTTFGTQGVARTGFAARSSDGAFALVLQPDGRLVAGGQTLSADMTASLFALARFNTDGSLDASFGRGGRVTTDFGPGLSDTVRLLAVQADGRIVASNGSAIVGGALGIGLARYNADGSLDQAFGSGGKVTAGFGGAATGLVLAGSQIVVTTPIAVGESNDFGVVQFNADGSLDTTFGSGGQATADFTGPIDATAVDALRQVDGKLVVVGGVSNGRTGDFALVRYNVDGSLDSTFGTGGRVVTDFDPGQRESASAAVLQPDGKLVVVGIATPIVSAIALARYNPDGGLDAGFGAGGKIVVDPGATPSAATDVALQSDGKIVVVASVQSLRLRIGSLLRFNPDGSRDTSFRGTGVGSFAGFAGLAVQPDDRLIVVGGLNSPFELPLPSLAVGRFNADGTADMTFGTDGRTEVSFGGGSASASDVTLQPDGRIVAAGTLSGPPLVGSALAVARLLPGGALDPSFGSAGRVETKVGSVTDFGPATVTVQPNGLIVVTGLTGANGGDFFVATYEPDGSPDPAFGREGRVTTDFGGGADIPGAILVQPDAKFVVAGSATVGGFKQFALARYEADTTFNPTPTSDDVRFVTALYRDLLGRDPDASGLAANTVQLDGARRSAVDNMALGFVTSVENRSNIIAGYYTTFLRRAAGPDEVRVWLARLLGGGTPEQVVAGIAASDEDFQRAGGTNAAWLDGLYRDLLGRDRDPGSQGFLDCLNARTCTREQVAAAVLASPEYRSLFVTQVYERFLGRQPGPDEIRPWLQFLALPAPPPPEFDLSEQFVARVLGSPEFFAHNGNTNQGWLDSLYRRLLNRLPDPVGYSTALQVLLRNSAFPRQADALGLVFSSEYRRKAVADDYTRFLRRTAAAGEIDFWAGALQAGATQEQVVAKIVASDEYFRQAGGTNAAWLDRLYRDLLGRDRDAATQGFLDCLNMAVCTREQIAAFVLGSVEYRRGFVQSYYTMYLGRLAADAELAVWVATLERGDRQEQVLAGIVASAEYFQRAGQ
jgi:uncharacterized delta-60 repeat protein